LPPQRSQIGGEQTAGSLTLLPGFVANSKYKIQALFKDFRGTKLYFSGTKIIKKKPYPRRRHSKFRLQCDTEVTCIQVLASKLSTNAKFQNLRDLHSRTFQVFSSTFKHLICFKALSKALKFLFQIQAFSRIYIQGLFKYFQVLSSTLSV